MFDLPETLGLDIAGVGLPGKGLDGLGDVQRVVMVCLGLGWGLGLVGQLVGLFIS